MFQGLHISVGRKGAWAANPLQCPLSSSYGSGHLPGASFCAGKCCAWIIVAWMDAGRQGEKLLASFYCSCLPAQGWAYWQPSPLNFSLNNERDKASLTALVRGFADRTQSFKVPSITVIEIKAVSKQTKLCTPPLELSHGRNCLCWGFWEVQLCSYTVVLPKSDCPLK